MILEPVTGSNGVIIPPKGYLQGVRAICTKYNIVMIADEVMAGFGRCGEWFSVDHFGVVPDIITMAKGITSAYTPLGAVAINKDIAKTFETKPFVGGLTYNSHPLTLAAAVACIQVRPTWIKTRTLDTGFDDKNCDIFRLKYPNVVSKCIVVSLHFNSHKHNLSVLFSLCLSCERRCSRRRRSSRTRARWRP